MPFVKRSGVSSQVDQKLKTKRQKIIEEERIRVLRESLMLFYDKLMEKYKLIHAHSEEVEGAEVEGAEVEGTEVEGTEVEGTEIEGEDTSPVSREEVETFAREYADTKPLGF